MASPIKLDQISYIAGKGVFFDANVLLYLFWPTGTLLWEASYARAFNALRNQGNPMLLDVGVLSEIVNRIIRIEYEKFKTLTGQQIPFKQFRSSTEGQNALQDVYTIIQSPILNYLDVVGKTFSKPDIESMLFVDDLDFIDKAIVEICLQHDLVLFTNDIDFKATGLTVLSGNPNYQRP